MLRFAPSPTGDMHIGNLRVAIINYIVAMQNNTNFIVRIEDTDKERNIEGKDREILQILEKFSLPYSQLFYQSANLHIHQNLAIKLLEENKAFICTCSPDELELEREKAKQKGVAYRYSGKCTNKTKAEIEDIRKSNTPFVIRIKKPDNDISFTDLIKGSITTKPNEVDSFVILRNDGTPTYNFACSCDDMLTNIDIIIRGEDHLSNTPKQIHIKNALGYKHETKYAHLPIILNNENKKMSKRDDASSVKWLLEQGFLPDAIINYLLLLGNKTPIEVFKLPDAVSWFDLKNISKSPAKFDIDKLRFLNREHFKAMDDKTFSKLFGFSDEEIGKLGKLYLEEASTLTELEPKIKAIFAPKNFDNEWSNEMRTIQNLLQNAPHMETYDEFKSYIIENTGLKGKNLFKPLRLLLTNAEHGPELANIYKYIKSYLLEVIS
ncbi:MAG: glutamylglutaminyl-tRNA ligase [Sulfurovum sp. AS07-7]|nr:MAG: glutamylglutaminyl-tRNA ligase [Sulfurovum sp. AS07-7]